MSYQQRRQKSVNPLSGGYAPKRHQQTAVKLEYFSLTLTRRKNTVCTDLQLLFFFFLSIFNSVHRFIFNVSNGVVFMGPGNVFHHARLRFAFSE